MLKQGCWGGAKDYKSVRYFLLLNYEYIENFHYCHHNHYAPNIKLFIQMPQR